MDNIDEGFTLAMGRLIRAEFRVPYDDLPNTLISSEGETVEEVIQSYVNSPEIWKKFSLTQKRQFAFASLAFCKVSGGELEMLLILLEKDADGVARDLSAVTNSQLKELFHFGAAEIQEFRTKLTFLRLPEKGGRSRNQ